MKKTQNQNKNQKKTSKQPSHFIGIGASAGGLEALQTLFRCLPEDTGAAYMIVQHLSPEYKSMMAELIARHTSMSVIDVVDGVTVEANCVYLSPPGHSMEISDGHLRIKNVGRHNSLYFPIDHFFESLAKDQENRTIVIVLSGTGSDGSHALKNVKEAGGLVIVQDKDSAKFDGMPRSSVNTGLADFELPPEKIGITLIRYMNHPYSKNEQTRLRELLEDNNSVLKEIFKLLKREYEIDFSHYKQSTIARRIERRMGIHQINNLNEYMGLLIDNQEEIKKLFQELLIGVTRFFRDTKSFKYISQKVLPELFTSLYPGEEFRAWVIGCSTGEETYSLAMEVHNMAYQCGFLGDIKIFSTDVDRKAIVEASEGKYNLDVEKDVPEGYLKKYFKRQLTHYEINAEIRKLIIFAVHNAITDAPFSNVHLVVCRNTLIYFQPSTQRRVLSSIHFALKNNGVLFLGASESVGEFETQFETLDLSNHVYRKKPNSYIPLADRPTPKSPTQTKLPTVSNVLRSYKRFDMSGKLKEAQENLIEQYLDPTIIIGEYENIEFVYGDISQFVEKMKSGKFSSLYADNIHHSIRNIVITAVNRCKNSQKPIHINKVPLIHSNATHLLELKVIPLIIEEQSVTFLAIIFSGFSKDKKIVYENRNYEDRAANLERIAQLEQDLKRRQDELQSTIEELETANQELQAANEELMASNEELQSTNEELQSVNEELYTVNSEFQEKHVELNEVNNDITNLMQSIEIGILLLDKKKQIKRFTSSIAKYIPLVETDIGRQISDITLNLDYPLFFHDLQQVSEYRKTVQREIEYGLHGARLLVQIKPYTIGRDNEYQGCVISINEISLLRKKQSEIYQTIDEMSNTIQCALDKPSQNTIKLLILDDNPVDAEMLKTNLESIDKNKYRIDQTCNESDAEKMLTTNEYDICLLDYHLTTMTAEKFLENLECNNTPAFIVLSRKADTKLFARLQNYNVYECLTKEEITGKLLDRCIHYALYNKRTDIYLHQLDSVLRKSSLEYKH